MFLNVVIYVNRLIFINEFNNVLTTKIQIHPEILL